MIRRNLKKFGFMGASLDTGNMGVSALSASVIQLIKNARPDTEIYLFLGNRSGKPQVVDIKGERIKVPVVNYRHSVKAPLSIQMWWIFLLAVVYRVVAARVVRELILKNNHWLRKLKSMDAVGDIFGGDSFSDIYGLHRFIKGCLPVTIAILLGCKVVLLPQTHGPFKSKIASRFARYIMENSAKILSRDTEGLAVVASLLHQSNYKPKVMFSPDVAFTLEPKDINDAEIRPPLPDEIHQKLVGLNINGLMYRGGYSGSNMFNLKMNYRKFAIEILEAILNDDKYRILIVPHTFGMPGNVNSDPDASNEIIQALSGKVDLKRLHMVAKPYNQSEMKAIIGKCDFFIGSRMHACIAALSQGIPTIGVAYSKKFKGVFESVGKGDDVVDARNVSASEAVKHIMTTLSLSDRKRDQLKQDMSAVRQQVIDIFKQII